MALRRIVIASVLLEWACLLGRRERTVKGRGELFLDGWDCWEGIVYHGCKAGKMVGVQLIKYITHEVARRRSFEAISSCRYFRAEPQDFDTKKSTQASKHRKESKNMKRD